MHLSVAQGSMRRHVFGDPADSTGGIGHDLVALVSFAVPQKAVSMYENA